MHFFFICRILVCGSFLCFIFLFEVVYGVSVFFIGRFGFVLGGHDSWISKHHTFVNVIELMVHISGLTYSSVFVIRGAFTHSVSIGPTIVYIDFPSVWVIGVSLFIAIVA